MSLRIRKNDTVVVLTGRDKNKHGKVINVDVKGNRALVQGLNKVKKHQRRTQQNPQGGFIETELPIAISNLNLYCEKTKKPTRFRTQILKDGSKERQSVRGKQSIGS